MTLPIFLFPTLKVGEESIALAEVQPGQTVLFSGPEADHARRSMRLQAGDYLELCDTQGGRLRVQVSGTGADGVQVLAVSNEQEAPPQIRFSLAQALAKAGRDEMAVEASTELGVNRVIPWQANRSVSRWSSAKAHRNQQKWRNLVWAATKQARRAFLPTVEEIVDSRGLTDLVGTVSGAGGLVLICDEDAQTTLAETVRQWLLAAKLSPTVFLEVLIVVGPEGGITPEEKESFFLAGGIPVLLGPNVLRTSTAGPAALTLLNYLVGRWETHPRRGRL